MADSFLFPRSFRIALIALIPLVLVATACGQSSDPSNDAVTLDLAIDGERLLQHVEILSSDGYQGRKAGTDGGEMTRSYLEGVFEEIGLAPACSEMHQPFSFEGREGTINAVNLIARIPGTSPGSGAIALTAHFDHLGVFNDEIYNGADDNASGTAALLEIARLVQSQPLERDLIVAAFDAEEQGLIGAREFVNSECFTGLDVRFNVNMDMISRSEAGEIYAAGTSHYTFVRPVLEAVDHSDAMELLFGHDRPGTTQMDWTSSSDHALFHRAGIPFIYFGVEDHPGYHNPSDDFEAIHPEFFQSAADYIYHAVRAIDAAMPGFPTRD